MIGRLPRQLDNHNHNNNNNICPWFMIKDWQGKNQGHISGDQAVGWVRRYKMITSVGARKLRLQCGQGYRTVLI